MYEVSSNEEGGLDEQNTKVMLINLQLYQGALDKCNQSIFEYNNLTSTGVGKE
jgi:hypothetical protein